MPPPPIFRLGRRYRPHVPLDKRKRAVQACIACRDRKRKCVLTAVNQCQNCTLAGQSCTFKPTPKAREDPPLHDLEGGNVLHWKAAAAHVSQSFHDRFPGIKLDAEHCLIIAQLFQQAFQEPQHELIAANSTTPTSLNQTATSIHSSATVEVPHSESHASFLEAISYTFPLVRVKAHDVSRLHSVKNLAFALDVIADALTQSYPQMNSVTSEETASLLKTILGQLPTYQHAETLVNVFFAVAESNWYYFDERWFRSLLVQTYQNGVSVLQPKDCPTICLVFLVLALGSVFEHLFRPTRILVTDHGIPGRTYFLQTSRLLPMVIAANSVESATCCLLTSLYLLSTEDISHHHIYLGLALNIAVGLALHRMGTGNHQPTRDREMNLRLFWTIYSIERHTSHIMGLPTILQLKDITASLPQKRQDLDGDDSHRVDRLIAFTKLTIVMDEVLNAGPVEQSSAIFDWACSKLEALRDSIPDYLLTVEESSFRANAHLNIMYNMIWVNIGRGALLRLVHRRLHPPSGGAISEGHEMYIRSQELAIRCTSAATAITSWISQMQSRNLLARFSFTDIHTCSSAVIVLLLNALLQNASQMDSAITRGIDALTFMADGSALAMNALRLVERLQQGIYQTTEPVNQDTRSGQQPAFLPTLDQELSHNAYLGHGGAIPGAVLVNHSTSGNSAPIIPSLDLTLFTDMERWFSEYSEQDLNLLGLDGFGPTSDLNFLL